MSETLKIFYHVGMGKVASTYLQYAVFPKFKDIKYIQRTKFRKYAQLISDNPTGKYLLSREFDRQMEFEVAEFAKIHPNTYPIIIFRENSDWIASQYRRFIKNGVGLSFNEFIDIDNNKGFWEREELLFMPKIRILEKYFSHPPLVLLYDDLKKDPMTFFKVIADYTGSTFAPEDISLEKIHKSYREKQLRFMRAIGKTLLPRGTEYSSHKIKASIQRYGRMLVKYPALFLGQHLPDGWVPEGPLINQEEKDAIREYCRTDWAEVLAYAQRQPALGNAKS